MKDLQQNLHKLWQIFKLLGNIQNHLQDFEK
ncbi:hypothetical protein T01_6430 [Trichinella spiralis]|uniref:Uncharacterized protein n=1 Tax=Trichinella spiralis TaxID=6334 RepID=A0A0V0YSB7_TRISP|nr:hypothetical protein T01_6430 [Trichinella spiralis]